MRDFAFVKQEDESVVRHIFIGTKEANQLTENYTMNEIDPEMTKFREKQHTSSIDTLTNQLKQMEADIKVTETSLEKKINECTITKDVLRMKLEDTLSGLHTEKNDLKLSPTMLSAKDLENLDINSNIDELKDPMPRKLSHEST